jgi:hypothetical protein
MPRKHGALRALIRKYFGAAVFATAALSLVAAAALADDNKGKKRSPIEPAVHLLSSVPIPISPTNTGTGTFSFDISFVDQSDGTYYLADRSNFAVDALLGGPRS